MQRKRFFVAGAMSAALFFSACGDDNDGWNSTPAPTGTSSPDRTATALPIRTTTAIPTATAEPSLTPTVLSDSQMRVIHGSPDAPNVDVLFDGEVVLTDVAYLAASDYLTVPSGVHNIQVRATGTDFIALDFDLALDARTDYTAIVTNFLEDLDPFALLDDRAPPGEGMTKVRIGHAAPSAPNVDIYVTAPGGELVDPVLTDVPFQFFSEYLTVPSGIYQVRVTATGSTDVVIDTGALTLDSNVVLTALALDAKGGGEPFSLELYLDSPA